MYSFAMGGAEKEPTWRNAQDEAKVNVYKVAVIVDHDIPVVSIFRLQ